MYFPYFYSGQHEAETIFKLKGEIDDRKLLPIVHTTHTKPGFITSITKVTISKTPFILVVNPIDINSSLVQQQLNMELIESLLNIHDNNIIIGIYIDYNNIDEISKYINKYKDNEIVLFHCDICEKDNSDTCINDLFCIIENSKIKYHIFRNNALKSYYQKYFKNNNKIIIEDPFIKRSPNSEYDTSSAKDEKFYDLHIRYKDDNYFGFGDFLTIGSSISDEQGRSPKTVVIHYTYPEDKNKTFIWIRRFFGKIEGDFSSQASARLAAMSSLNDFIISHSETLCNTCIACYNFKKKVNKGDSYNLGHLKQFSMLHHVHMIIKLINT